MFSTARDHDLILIIDDDGSTPHPLNEILGAQAHLIFAHDGARGLDLAAREKPELILLNAQLPGLDGYAICRALLADTRTAHSAIIIMTTANDRESEIAALAVGAVDCIAKPFNPPLVQARVNTQLRLRRQTIELNKLTNRDTLTGLFNRHHFDVALDSEFERHRRQQTSLAIALLDVDYFQAFNDSYGQPGCDRCLQQIGAVIKFAACRPGEAAARIDGEEFALLLPNHTANIAKAHGERLCAKIAALQIPHTQSSVKNIVTVSVGIAARVPNADDTPQLLINAADRALYQAKSNGHNQVVIADLL